MAKTDAYSVVSVLKSIFSTFGLPKELVSDNGPPFGSKVFRLFCKANGIIYTDPPTYHPPSNGAAERAVGTCKKALKKMDLHLKNINLTLDSLVSNFLIEYRHTPSTVTCQSPSDLIFSFKPRTLLDSITNIKPGVKFEDKLQLKKKEINTKRSEIVNKNVKYFHTGQKVWYLSPHKNTARWIPAVIIKRLSKVIYSIDVDNIIKKAHGNQLKEKVERNPKYFVDTTVKKKMIKDNQKSLFQHQDVYAIEII